MQGGGEHAPRERRRGASPEQGRGQPSRPARDKKCVQGAGARAGRRGGKPRATAPRGNPPTPCSQNTAPAEKKGAQRQPLCRAKREPRRGVPAGAADAPAAGARQGQPPHRAEKPTRPDGRLCYAKRRWGQRTTASREMRRAAARKDKTRAAATTRGTAPRASAAARKSPPQRPRRPRGYGAERRRERPPAGAERRGEGAYEHDTHKSPHDRRSETSYRAGRRAPPARRRSRGDARAPPSLTRRPRRMASTSDRHRIAIASPSDRGRSSVRVTRGRARSVRACAADRLCLLGFYVICVCYLWGNACRIY